jgi:hypothetical protein
MSAHPNEISRARRSESLQKECDQIFQDHYKEVDRAHLERLCQRYHNLVPPEQIRAVKDLPTAFEDRQHFEQSCCKDHVQRFQDGDQVVGYSRGTLEPAHVDVDNSQWEKTVVHERLHQLAEPSGARQLGRCLNEGVTEDLAIHEMEARWHPELPRSYPEQRALAHKMREVCGDRPVDRAYFQGDVRELRTCLDDRLGKGSLDRLKDMAERSSEQSPEEAGDKTHG